MSARMRAVLLIAGAALLPRAGSAQQIAEVQIAPPFMRMVQDAQAQFIATVYDANGRPVNARLRWSSSNINVASVDSTGTIRGLTPGSAIITAIAEKEGRRVLTRATVQVVRPRGEPRFVRVDSLMRTPVNCSEPFMNATNPMRACWDTKPMLVDSVFTPPERPGRDVCPNGVGNVTLLVQVNHGGRVDGVLPFMAERCPEYTRILVETVRRLEFTPAMKEGKPIRAWVRLQARGQ